MELESSKKIGVAEELHAIAARGIQADRKKLKKDMCEQFADPREWIREFVVNAYDADANVCWISGWEDEQTLTITVEDNGHGMDRQGVMDFNMLYRSVKKPSLNTAVGQFGVGKLSVAAIKGQSKFVMTTSTGKETWRMKANCLLDDDLILLEKLHDISPQGTKFEITFTKEHGLHKELLELEKVLKTYLRYKDITISISDQNGESRRWLQPYGWDSKGLYGYADPYSRRYLLDLDGKKFDVVLSIGETSHEVYKQRVLITNRYNLLFTKGKRVREIPYLTIRVDSDDFMLPIGRHCLSNEDELSRLTKKLWADLIPQYLNEILRIYQRGFPQGDGHLYTQIEAMTCALMLCKGASENVWNRYPLFLIKNGDRLSLAELQEQLIKKGKLYIESEVTFGADYSIFDVPVLAKKQPKGGDEIINTMFGDYIIKLGTNDIIFERPNTRGETSACWRRNFSNILVFTP